MGQAIVVYRSAIIPPEFLHGFPERQGGVSEGLRASLNLGFRWGDNAAHVEENRRLLAVSEGYPPAALQVTKHVHGTNVWQVGEPLPEPPELPTEMAIKLADILYQASVAVGRGVDLLGLPHPKMKECSVQVNSLENEADRVSRDAISALFENETNPIAVIKWKEIYENFEAGTDRCEDVANILERITLKHH